ncbi:hypothetical protein G5I_04674 [Acromyrmex echinatior]|uniref:Uncharacterized protein n=1 Tax=Acromyrmex echinatior TaxID=103372 RepID=F4WGA0_ACREC|nr:hypothetical protein G5I_04674 [Acromyrmex echinatior]
MITDVRSSGYDPSSVYRASEIGVLRKFQEDDQTRSSRNGQRSKSGRITVMVKETKGRAVALGANDLSRVKTGCVDSKVVKRFFADSITYQAALMPCSFTARSYHKDAFATCVAMRQTQQRTASDIAEHADSKRSVRISRPAMIRRYRNRMKVDVASLAPRYVSSRIIAIAVIAILLIMKRPIHTAHLNGSLPSLTVNVEVDDRGQWLVQGLWFELKFDAAPRRRFLPTSTAASVPRIVDGRLARSVPADPDLRASRAPDSSPGRESRINIEPALNFALAKRPAKGDEDVEETNARIAANVSSNQPSNQINDLNVTSEFLTVLSYEDSSLGERLGMTD